MNFKLVMTSLQNLYKLPLPLHGGLYGGLTEEGAQPQLANVAWLQTQQIEMVKVTRRKCIRTSVAPKHSKAANKVLPKTTLE